ncbi:hypothetical protein AAC387_Pa08g2557 [Persea americana]
MEMRDGLEIMLDRGFEDEMDHGRWREGDKMDHGEMERGFGDAMWIMEDEYCLGQGFGNGDETLPPIPFCSQVSPQFKAELTQRKKGKKS